MSEWCDYSLHKGDIGLGDIAQCTCCCCSVLGECKFCDAHEGVAEPCAAVIPETGTHDDTHMSKLDFTGNWHVSLSFQIFHAVCSGFGDSIEILFKYNLLKCVFFCPLDMNINENFNSIKFSMNAQHKMVSLKCFVLI